MANNFTQLCMQVTTKSPEGRQWLQNQHEVLCELQDVLDGDETDADSETVYEDANNVLAARGSRTLDPELLKAVMDWDPLSTTPLPGFDIEVNREDVYFEDDGENIELDRLADFLQVYLQKNDPEGSQEFEYAFTADHHRPGSFGGGACFITANETEWMASNNWLYAKRQTFENKKTSKAPQETS